MVKKRAYERIEGTLWIWFDGKIFLDKTEVKCSEEILHIPVTKLKQIIKDVVADTKAGLWK